MLVCTCMCVGCMYARGVYVCTCVSVVNEHVCVCLHARLCLGVGWGEEVEEGGMHGIGAHVCVWSFEHTCVCVCTHLCVYLVWAVVRTSWLWRVCLCVQGWVPRSQLSTVEITHPQSTFYKGQVVRCRVLSCYPDQQKLHLSLVVSYCSTKNKRVGRERGN